MDLLFVVFVMFVVFWVLFSGLFLDLGVGWICCYCWFCDGFGLPLFDLYLLRCDLWVWGDCFGVLGWVLLWLGCCVCLFGCFIIVGVGFLFWFGLLFTLFWFVWCIWFGWDMFVDLVGCV